MGCGQSTQAAVFDYDAALLGDTKAAQSVVFGAQQAPNRTPIRRNADKPDALATTPVPGVDTIWKAWTRGSSNFKKSKFLGTRVFTGTKNERGAYVYQTYEEVDELVKGYGAGLASLGLRAQDSVAIYAINRAEWTVSNLGNFSQGFRTVALYDTLGADAASYIVGHADCKAVVASKDKLKKVFAIAKSCPEVKVIVQFDVDARFNNLDETLDEADVKTAEAAGIKLLSFSQLVKLGKESGIFPVEPQPEDLAFIMYTSGTTGQPKGAMLTHGNIMSVVAGAMQMFPLNDKDVHVSYLPLAHIFETVVQVAVFTFGGSIAFYSGDPRKLPEDFKEAQVTVLCGVPRVFEKIYDKVQKGIASANCIKKWVAEKAFREQAAHVRVGTRDAGWDNKVFIPMRTLMGLQNVRLIVTGAAPMAAYLSEFLRVVIGCPVCQGYGMTETAAASTISRPSDCNVGHVGPPLISSEICLEDVEEMGYKSTDKYPRGEVLIRGPNIFKGYFKNEKATEEALDRDGWIHTGDVGRWNPNGTLSIIDRKKNMLKLSQGEYIALEKVEAAYKNTWCNQIWVYGNSYHSFLLAAVVPYPETVVPWLQEKGWWTRNDLKISGDPAFLAEFKKVCDAHITELNEVIYKSIIESAVANKLSSLEKVKGPLIIETELDDMFLGFNVNNDCLTPTQKLRRPQLVRRYEARLRELYTSNGEAPGAGERW